MSDAITITGCRLWLEGRFSEGKLCLEGGHISKLGTFDGVRGLEIPCDGLAVFPALIDNHVHFREPGAEEKEGFASGSAASAHGGATSVLEVQNSAPLLDSPERAHAKRRLVGAKSRIKVGFYASATPLVLPHLREMGDLCKGLKLFMAPSHGDEGVGGEESMRPYFQSAAEMGIHLIVHAEDGGIVARESKKYGDKGPAFFSKARPPLAEIAAVECALKLAGEYGTRLHVFHVTTAGAVDLIVDAARRGVNVTSSTCPHYLFFTEKDVARKGGLLKVNPSIKGKHDQQRLLEAVRENEIQILSTDHAPHRPEEKSLSFHQVPAGVSSADVLLPLLSTLVARGAMDFKDVERLCVSNPAKIHDLFEESDLKAGRVADLVLFDPEEEWTVRPEDFLSKGKLSPYTGMKLTGRVAATLMGGRTVYLDEEGPLKGKLPPPELRP